MLKIRTRTAVLAALALTLVAPVAAQTAISVDATDLAPVNGVIHLGTFAYEGGLMIPVDDNRAPGDEIWDNSLGVGSFYNAPFPEETLDTGDLPDGTWVGEFQIGFATDASGSVSMRYSFYTNNNFNTVGAPLITNGGDEAVFEVTASNLVGGGTFAYTLNIVLNPVDNFQITGADVDGNLGTDWGWGFTVTDPGNSTALGPLIAGEQGVGAPGREDHFDRFSPAIADGGTYVNTVFFGGVPFAQFHMLLYEGAEQISVIEIPTLSGVGLVALVLALATLAVLVARRRTRSAN